MHLLAVLLVSITSARRYIIFTDSKDFGVILRRISKTRRLSMSAQVEEIAPDDAAAEPAKPTGTKKKAKSKPKPASAEKKEKIKAGKWLGKYSHMRKLS